MSKLNYFFSKALLILLFTAHSAHSQQTNNSFADEQLYFRCSYSLDFQPDSTSGIINHDSFLLLIGKSKSRFIEKTYQLHDSLLNSYSSASFNQAGVTAFGLQMKNISFPVFTYSIYKNHINSSISYSERVGSALYCYDEQANLFNWHILPETLVINGFKCQKATTYFAGRDFVAWFTREVPINDGPYKFNGLPGLIVKINDTKGYYIFSLLTIHKLSSLSKFKSSDSKCIAVTKQKFMQGKADYAIGAAGRMSAMGNTVTDAQIKAHQEKVKRRNNPLELK